MKNADFLFYPGEAPDAEDFAAARNRLGAPPTTSSLPLKWCHDDLVDYLANQTSIESQPAEHVGDTQSTQSFSHDLDFAKRNATIHLPGTDYALPDWAMQFEEPAEQIIKHEHATNPRADAQVAQLRIRQNKGQPRNTNAHLDMVLENVRNFHLYLVADAAATTSFTGCFTYVPHYYEGMETMEFFRDLDTQFDPQVNRSDIASHTSSPFEIIALSALTVHQPPRTAASGRTLFGIQFYELATDK